MGEGEALGDAVGVGAGVGVEDGVGEGVSFAVNGGVIVGVGVGFSPWDKNKLLISMKPKMVSSKAVRIFMIPPC